MDKRISNSIMNYRLLYAGYMRDNLKQDALMLPEYKIDFDKAAEEMEKIIISLKYIIHNENEKQKIEQRDNSKSEGLQIE